MFYYYRPLCLNANGHSNQVCMFANVSGSIPLFPDYLFLYIYIYMTPSTYEYAHAHT